MKIGLVCPYNFSRQGGVQKLITVLDGELTARGHDVRIITPRPRDFKGKPPPRVLFVGQSAKWNTPIKTTLEVGMTLETDGLEDMLYAEHFDVIHVHEPEVPILGAQIAARADCPIIATFHATFPETTVGKTIEFFRPAFARSIFKNIAHMTAVSDTAARFVREWTELPVDIVPNYVNIEYFRNTKPVAPSKKDTILFIGRLEKRKGVKYLLEAYNELTKFDKDAELIIAGDGPEREKLELWVRENNVPHVKFMGAVSEAVKLKLLHKASLFCSPALFGESFGIVLLEAMAANVPIVAGDNPGYACVMKDRGILSLVNPKDTLEFTRRLDVMLHDDELRKLWIKWSKEAIQQYDFKQVIDKYEAVYNKALKLKGGRK